MIAYEMRYGEYLKIDLNPKILEETGTKRIHEGWKIKVSTGNDGEPRLSNDRIPEKGDDDEGGLIYKLNYCILNNRICKRKNVENAVLQKHTSIYDFKKKTENIIMIEYID